MPISPGRRVFLRIPIKRDAADQGAIRSATPLTLRGIDFKTEAVRMEKNFPNTPGSGVALVDYDGDGWLDVYFGTTRMLPTRGAGLLARKPTLPKPR